MATEVAKTSSRLDIRANPVLGLNLHQTYNATRLKRYFSKKQNEFTSGRLRDRPKPAGSETTQSVSYTHLTLPTTGASRDHKVIKDRGVW